MQGAALADRGAIVSHVNISMIVIGLFFLYTYMAEIAFCCDGDFMHYKTDTHDTRTHVFRWLEHTNGG
jgi:hypothetical protein